jgi:cell cycle sensor histidine kinase DivJ
LRFFAPIREYVESLARTSFRPRHAEEDRYCLLARNMSDVITRHGSNREILFISPPAEALFGASLRDLCGDGLFNRVHVGDRPAYLSALADSATRGETGSVEFRVRRDGGAADHPTFIWIEMRCRALDLADEEHAAAAREVVAVLRDITQHKEQEQALEQAHAAAEHANAGKSRFLATMSHELRTPLNAIIGFSDMLTNGSLTIDAKRRHEYAHLINESGHHLLAVVNGILDMSKIETGNFQITPESFSPAQVIDDCYHLLAFKAREQGIALAVRLPDGLPEIVADKRALHQIMLNLMSNAIKFSDHGGKITVSATVDDTNLAIIVEDTGVGIGAEDMPRIGDPFFQARSSYDRRHAGTGLGLSIVKGLLALHGGHIDIASRLGEGTKITIRLPRDCERARQHAAAATVGTLIPRATAAMPDERMKISA